MANWTDCRPSNCQLWGNSRFPRSSWCNFGFYIPTWAPTETSYDDVNRKSFIQPFFRWSVIQNTWLQTQNLTIIPVEIYSALKLERSVNKLLALSILNSMATGVNLIMLLWRVHVDIISLLTRIDLYRIRFCNRGWGRQSHRNAKHNDN